MSWQAVIFVAIGAGWVVEQLFRLVDFIERGFEP